MTPFRRWIESKCKYSTQWGACNVSSSARSASDLGVLLNLSPVSFLRCVPVVVASINLLFLFPLPLFSRARRRNPQPNTRGCVVPTPCKIPSPPLPLFICRAAPAAAAAHAPAGGTARCRAGLVIVRDSVTNSAVAFFLLCVHVYLYVFLS